MSGQLFAPYYAGKVGSGTPVAQPIPPTSGIKPANLIDLPPSHSIEPSSLNRKGSQGISLLSPIGLTGQSVSMNHKEIPEGIPGWLSPISEPNNMASSVLPTGPVSIQGMGINLLSQTSLIPPLITQSSTHESSKINLIQPLSQPNPIQSNSIQQNLIGTTQPSLIQS